MLSFFRINDPYRLLILLLAILAVRLPYLIGSEPLLYELEWLTIGHSLIGEDTILFKDFLSPIAPLSALVYTSIVFVFGKSTLVLQLFALGLLAYQFSLFNNIMYKNKAYNENSYIPAFIYALLMQSFFDFFTLSPVLISLTFILLVLDNIYLRIENKLDDFTILKTGFFMGLAVLFYLPTILFFVATIFSFALLTSLIFRRYLLFLYGFMLPILMVCLYYLWNDALLDLINHWVFYTFQISTENILNIPSLLIIVSIPTLAFLIAVYKTFSFQRFTNYQVRVQQVMFIMFLAAWGCWLLSNNKAPYQLMIFVPFLAFFITHFILLFRKKAAAELFAILFATAIIGVNYYIYNEGSLLRSFGNFHQLSYTETFYHPWTSNKKVLVLFDEKELYYEGGKKVGKYFEWSLSQAVWDNFQEPMNTIAIYDYFIQYAPETIIDPNHYMGRVFQLMPAIKENYKKISADIYVLKS